MIILDTSVWIEFYKKSEKYFSEVRNLIENRQILAHEPIFAELLQGVKNQRENSFIQQYWEFLPKVQIVDCWIKAGIFSAEKKLLSFGVGLIDACIIVAAYETRSQIWTLDKKLISVVPHNMIWKTD